VRASRGNSPRCRIPGRRGPRLDPPLPSKNRGDHYGMQATGSGISSAKSNTRHPASKSPTKLQRCAHPLLRSGFPRESAPVTRPRFDPSHLAIFAFPARDSAYLLSRVDLARTTREMDSDPERELDIASRRGGGSRARGNGRPRLFLFYSIIRSTRSRICFNYRARGCVARTEYHLHGVGHPVGPCISEFSLSLSLPVESSRFQCGSFIYLNSNIERAPLRLASDEINRARLMQMSVPSSDAGIEPGSCGCLTDVQTRIPDREAEARSRERATEREREKERERESRSTRAFAKRGVLSAPARRILNGANFAQCITRVTSSFV